MAKAVHLHFLCPSLLTVALIICLRALLLISMGKHPLTWIKQDWTPGCCEFYLNYWNNFKRCSRGRDFFYVYIMHFSKDMLFFLFRCRILLLTVASGFINLNLFGSCDRYMEEQNPLHCVKNLTDLYKYINLINWECDFFIFFLINGLMVPQNFFFARGLSKMLARISDLCNLM